MTSEGLQQAEDTLHARSFEPVNPFADMVQEAYVEGTPSPEPDNPLSHGEIMLLDQIAFDELTERLRLVEFRGVFTKDGGPIRPYERAKFSLATVCPPEKEGQPPTIVVNRESTADESEAPLWTPQPTIYENQIQVVDRVAQFLGSNGLNILELAGAVDYEWTERGRFSIMPPLVEAQKLPLKNGRIDMDAFSRMFDGLYVPDGRGTKHRMANRSLTGFYKDEVEDVEPAFDIFNDSVRLLSYGDRRANSTWEYFIICDGSHRIDYAIEEIGEPIQVILVEPEDDDALYPYYALPMPFRPTTRLSSKKAEVFHPTLERDKVHVLQAPIKKVLHYKWEKSGLNVSSLRAEQK